MIKESIKLRGDLDVVVYGADGQIKEKRELRNLIVASGLNYICSRMKDATLDPISHMGLGSGTIVAEGGDTDLGALVGARELLDSTTVSANTITYVASFEAGDATGALTEAGLFNADTAGTMLCRTVFPVVNKQASDTMSITWTITLSAS